jgi:hypothetical protein
MTENLKITISDDRKIQAIQNEFKKAFPFLSIEFFVKPHTKYGSSPHKFIKSHAKTLGECRTLHKKGHVEISPGMAVKTLEEMFQDNYGISILIFRKSGKTWLETTATDGWSLEKQNAEGKALSVKPTTMGNEDDTY